MDLRTLILQAALTILIYMATAIKAAPSKSNQSAGDNSIQLSITGEYEDIWRRSFSGHYKLRSRMRPRKLPKPKTWSTTITIITRRKIRVCSVAALSHCSISQHWSENRNEKFFKNDIQLSDGSVLSYQSLRRQTKQQTHCSLKLSLSLLVLLTANLCQPQRTIITNVINWHIT